ncbi:hypothetical protein CEXT_103021 [Caerostris extrusa]|uniref:Uncharacterized protein n=1 Tax=Caerostris extrusa TaxID=172846 RepID=A0AAV4X6D1_CAEEX|nr:hypothetical protein CEXT_103021 [Caerostris extrusa]
MCRQTLRLINGKQGLVVSHFRSPGLLKGRLPIFNGTGDINKENVCTLFKDDVWPQVCTKNGLITERTSPLGLPRAATRRSTMQLCRSCQAWEYLEQWFSTCAKRVSWW